MAKSFSLAGIVQPPQTVQPIANDTAQAIQVGANIATKVKAMNDADKEKEDQSNYYQANIAYRNTLTKYDEEMLGAGNDLNKQRAVIDKYKGLTSEISSNYGLNEKYASNMMSTIENDFSKQEAVYRGRVNSYNKSIVSSNIADVVVNSQSRTVEDKVSEFQGLKEYAVSEGYTPQEASNIIAQTVLNTMDASITANTSFIEASSIKEDFHNTMLSFDDKLVGTTPFRTASNILDAKVEAIKKNTIDSVEAYGTNILNSQASVKNAVDDLVKMKALTKDEGVSFFNKINKHRRGVFKEDAKLRLSDPNYNWENPNVYNDILLVKDGNRAEAMKEYTKGYFKSQISNMTPVSTLVGWNTTGTFTMPDGSTARIPDSMKSAVKDTLEDKQQYWDEFGNYNESLKLVNEGIISGTLKQKYSSFLTMPDVSTAEGKQQALSNIEELSKRANANMVAVKKILGDDGYKRFKLLQVASFKNKVDNDIINKIDDLLSGNVKLTGDTKYFNENYPSKVDGDMRFIESDRDMFYSLKTLFPDMSNSDAMDTIEDYRAQHHLTDTIDTTGYTGSLDEGTKEALEKIIPYEQGQGSYFTHLTYNPKDGNLYGGVEGNKFIRSLGTIPKAVDTINIKTEAFKENLHGVKTPFSEAVRKLLEATGISDIPRKLHFTGTFMSQVLDDVGEIIKDPDINISSEPWIDWSSNPDKKVPKELKETFEGDKIEDAQEFIKLISKELSK